MSTAPERGIILTAAELATEGADRVLDAIAATGATAVATTTSVVVPSETETDLREPPIDVAGDRRALDRPIWGSSSRWVHRYTAHPPDPDLWRDLPWPEPPVAPEAVRVDHARHAIDAARARGLQTWVNFAPYALPTGDAHRDGMPTNDELLALYRPERFVGGIHPEAISWVGCINKPMVRRYGRVRLVELLRHYGDVDGIALEWVEFPVYFLEKLFTCFCEHCRAQAIDLGYDWDEITAAVRMLWDSLHALTEDKVLALIDSGDWGELVVDPEAMRAGFGAWLDYKADAVTRAIDDLRQTMADHGAGHLALSTATPAPPWGRMSGAGYERADRVVTQRVKLYSAQWLLMVRWWSNTIVTWNRGSSLTPDLATRAILSLFGIEFTDPPATFDPAALTVPAPGEPHGLTPQSYTHRLDTALALGEHQAPILPLLHAYRPADEFARLLDVVRPYAGNGLWVHRYGYLSDEKLEILRQDWSRS